jgi:uncharacterized damage-inducible protein DinB
VSEAQSSGRLLAARLRSAADEMLAEVERIPAALVTWKPADDVWSVMEILGHVQEFVGYWTAQTLQVIGNPDQPWGRTHADKDRLAAVEDAVTRRLTDVAAAVRQSVRQSAEAIERLSDAELAVEAPSRNPRWGVKPASFIVDDLLVQHVEKHLGQIRRNLAQFEQRPPG